MSFTCNTNNENKMTDITKFAVEDLIEKPLKDLLVLQERLNAAVERKKSTERVDFAKHLRELAKANGFELEDLAAIKVKKDRKPRENSDQKAEPKFRNPNNSEQMWSGRGLKPKWLQQLIDGGASLESFKI